MQYATPWSRFLSACTDITVFRLLLDLGSLILPSAWFANNSVVFLAIAICILLTYFVPRVFLKGQTLGMWFFGYRIVKTTKGKRLTWIEEVLRFLSQSISALLLLLPFTYSLFNKQHAHFSDLVVDGVPQKVENPIGDARSFQRFLGVLLLVAAVNGLLAAMSRAPAIDLYGRIVKGEPARAIHLLLSLLCITAGLLNILGKKYSAHAAAFLYLFLLVSSIWSLAIFDSYQIRVSQNLQQTMTQANTLALQPINEKMLKGFIQETDKYMRQNLRSSTLVNLFINAICFVYMLGIIFIQQLQPIRNSIHASMMAGYEKIKLALGWANRRKI